MLGCLHGAIGQQPPRLARYPFEVHLDHPARPLLLVAGLGGPGMGPVGDDDRVAAKVTVTGCSLGRDYPRFWTTILLADYRENRVLFIAPDHLRNEVPSAIRNAPRTNRLTQGQGRRRTLGDRFNLAVWLPDYASRR